jgi:hypothetical protein
VICLVKKCGADVNKGDSEGRSPLHAAAHEGHLSVVIYLVKEFGGDVNQAMLNGGSPLMVASARKHGAHAQALHQHHGATAADISRHYGAPAELTAYLEARTYCTNPRCDSSGLKNCAGCLQVFFCGPACIRAHWPAHKAECKRIAAAAASKEE